MVFAAKTTWRHPVKGAKSSPAGSCLFSIDNSCDILAQSE